MLNNVYVMLDVSIGLMVAYLLLSLICSSLSEGLESFLRNRSRKLERGIREILSDPDGTRLTHLVYNHPLIAALFPGPYDPSKIVRGVYRGRDLPSYIPATSFALALLDVIYPSLPAHPGGATATLIPAVAAEKPMLNAAAGLREAAARAPVPEVGRSLLILIDASGSDAVFIRRSIEEWFNTGMDRVSGWYKRRVQMLLFVVALCIASVINLDTIQLANRLANDPSLRASLAAAAQQYAASEQVFEEAHDAPLPPARGAREAYSWKRFETRAERIKRNVSRIQELQLPVGWQSHPESPNDWMLKVAGILATSMAATFGAPFWFDILGRFVSLRAAVKPIEKGRDTPEKKSETK